MNKANLLVSHLLEKIESLVGKIVGKSKGREFKFYIDMVYGILKSKSIVPDDD